MSTRRRPTGMSLEETFEVSIQKASEAKKGLLAQLKSQRKAIDRQIRSLTGKKKSKKKSKKAS